MKNREKIFIIILLTLLLVTTCNFVIKEVNRKKSEKISKIENSQNLDKENQAKEMMDKKENQAKEMMDKMECPFPLIGYNELTNEEKIKLSPKLNGLLSSLSVTKQKCSDYFPEIKYLWQETEPEKRQPNSSAPLVYIHNDKILIIINAFSSTPVTTTSTAPTYMDDRLNSNNKPIVVTSKFGVPSDTYLFYSLNKTPTEIIKMAKDNNIASIDLGENVYMDLID